MSHKIVIAVDSFKGSLTSIEVAAALARGVHQAIPSAEVVEVPLSDGGEGFAELLTAALGGRREEVDVVDALGRPLRSWYGVARDGRMAIMDAASTVGLSLLTADERNPMKSSSRGVGRMVVEAMRRGAREIIIGLGGSSTVDCGMGALAALGYRFVTADGESVGEGGGALRRVDSIDESNIVPELVRSRLMVAVDVLNPLCGPQGAARLFGPQKGASAADVEKLEEGAHNFARIVKRHTRLSVENFAGAGAAGGMGAGFYALAGAEIRSGMELFCRTIGFDRILEGCELVITGEGCIDSQTLLGKVPSGVLRHAQSRHIPVVAVGGSVKWCDELAGSGFERILSATPKEMTLSEAMKSDVAIDNLQRAGEKIALEWLKR